MKTLIENCAIVTVAGEEYASGHLVIEGDRILSVGPAKDGTLFEWLTELYPIWAGMDAAVLVRGGRAS